MKGIVLGFFVFTALNLPSALAHENDESDWEQAARLVEQGRIRPLDRVVQDALHRRPGRPLEVEFERRDGRWLYEVEILDATGRVWEFYYDAETGDLVKQGPSSHAGDD